MTNGIFEAAIILFFIPLIVSIGAGSTINGTRENQICKFLGDISYPLYITHLPFVYMQIAWIKNHPEAPTSAVVMLTVSLFVVSIAVAYATLKLYDIPVRKWLTENWLKRK